MLIKLEIMIIFGLKMNKTNKNAKKSSDFYLFIFFIPLFLFFFLSQTAPRRNLTFFPNFFLTFFFVWNGCLLCVYIKNICRRSADEKKQRVGARVAKFCYSRLKQYTRFLAVEINFIKYTILSAIQSRVILKAQIFY